MNFPMYTGSFILTVIINAREGVILKVFLGPPVLSEDLVSGLIRSLELLNSWVVVSKKTIEAF